MESNIMYDKLTGLCDFRSFIRVTEKLIKDNPDDEFAILVSDIVQFKVINDLYGMETGDRLLKNIADDIRTKISNGTCGRIGNDKFACCVFYNGEKLSSISNIYEFYVSEAVGIHKVLMQTGCYFVKDRDIPVIKMCDRALLALNSIKGKFTETVAVYTSARREDILMGQTLAADIDAGIRERQFKAYIQPIYYANTNTVAGGEVLVRWEHPTLGFLPPGKFIGYFEKNYLISKLDKFVWEEACRMVRRMIDEDRVVVPLSVNVSRMDMLYDDISDTFINLVNKYEIDPSDLKIEITESAYMDNPEKLKNTIEKLNDYGFPIVMDDFGTGFSSLNTLRNLPFKTVKIDKELIDEIDKSVKAGNVVYSIVNMAKWLGMDVVAEGVEEINQVNFLKHIGCKCIQGFYFSKPLPEEEFFAKDFNFRDTRPEQSDEINLESLFTIEDPEIRSFLNKLVGAILHYELDGDKLILKWVNDEFYNRYDIKTPYELFELRNGEILGDDIKILKACKDAMSRNETVGTDVEVRDAKGKKLTLNVKVYYLGCENGKPQFLFNSTDITRRIRKHIKRSMLDYIEALSMMCTEIIVLNYTDDLANTIYINLSEGGLRYSNTPISRILDNLNRVIVPEDYERVRKELSFDSMKTFCREGLGVKFIRFGRREEDGRTRKCEIFIIDNKDEYGRVVVTVGNRVIGE